MPKEIFRRHPANPIIMAADVKPSRPDWRVAYVINAGVTEFNGKVRLLLRVAETPNTDPASELFRSPYFDPVTGRVEYRTYDRRDPLNDFSDTRFVVRRDAGGREVERALSTISHLRLADSDDGVHFTVAEAPALSPTSYYEQFGLEDPRITRIGDEYYINYSAISPSGDVTALAVTRNFTEYQRCGVIFPPDNKDVCLFPRPINGRYYALHRPGSAKFGLHEMWISESPDLRHWGNHRLLYGCRNDAWGDRRNGCGAVPIELEEGWLEIYHAADRDHRYSLGLLLLDKEDPSRVIAAAPEPVLLPEADYELHGFFGNVVFCCGALPANGKIRIYYGCADTSIAMAEAPLQSLLDTLKMQR